MEKKREREIETEEREIKGEREKDRESERTGVRVRETRDEWEGEAESFYRNSCLGLYQTKSEKWMNSRNRALRNSQSFAADEHGIWFVG